VVHIVEPKLDLPRDYQASLPGAGPGLVLTPHRNGRTSTVIGNKVTIWKQKRGP
jgi:hypothetical protein